MQTSPFFPQLLTSSPARRCHSHDSFQFSSSLKRASDSNRITRLLILMKIGCLVGRIEHLRMPMESVTDFIDVCKVAFTQSTTYWPLLQFGRIGISSYLRHKQMRGHGKLIWPFALHRHCCLWSCRCPLRVQFDIVMFGFVNCPFPTKRKEFKKYSFLLILN